jgi:hypothetical protein
MAKASKKDGVMDAVTALTTLGDEEEGKVEEESLQAKAVVGDDGEGGKVRYIPEHKKPDAALTFPEKVSFNECSLWMHGSVGIVLYYSKSSSYAYFECNEQTST